MLFGVAVGVLVGVLVGVDGVGVGVLVGTAVPAGACGLCPCPFALPLPWPLPLGARLTTGASYDTRRTPGSRASASSRLAGISAATMFPTEASRRTVPPWAAIAFRAAPRFVRWISTGTRACGSRAAFSRRYRSTWP